jgi:hypothetical protein
MATSTDSVYRLYNWYLGRHSFLHLQKRNKRELMRRYPRLPQGEKPEEYEKQLSDLEKEK